MEIKQIRILEGDTLEKLESRVNAFLLDAATPVRDDPVRDDKPKANWQPLGGIVFTPDGNAIMLMVEYFAVGRRWGRFLDSVSWLLRVGEIEEGFSLVGFGAGVFGEGDSELAKGFDGEVAPVFVECEFVAGDGDDVGLGSGV